MHLLTHGYDHTAAVATAAQAGADATRHSHSLRTDFHSHSILIDSSSEKTSKENLKLRKSEQLLYGETKPTSNPQVAHFFDKSKIMSGENDFRKSEQLPGCSLPRSHAHLFSIILK